MQPAEVCAGYRSRGKEVGEGGDMRVSFPIQGNYPNLGILGSLKQDCIYLNTEKGLHLPAKEAQGEIEVWGYQVN